MSEGTWTNLTDVFSPRPKPVDENEQRWLREQAIDKANVAFARVLAEGRLPDENWRHRAACNAPGVNELFFPSPRDPFNDPKREWQRNVRLDLAVQVCEGGADEKTGVTHLPCPVRHQCRAFGLRVGGSDKIAVFGGLTWNQRKKILSELRWEAWERAALGLADHDITHAEWWDQLRHARRIALGRAAGDFEAEEWDEQIRVAKDVALGRAA